MKKNILQTIKLLQFFQSKDSIAKILTSKFLRIKKHFPLYQLQIFDIEA